MTTFHFAVSLRYEIFYALQALADPSSRIDGPWRETALAALPADGQQALRAVGDGPAIWGVVADVPRTAPVENDFEALVAHLRAVPLADFQAASLSGALHDGEATKKLLAGKTTLKRALAASKADKREWLAFAGLYPYQAEAPMVRALERLIAEPEAFQRDVVTALTAFWQSSFRETWAALMPQLERSLAEKQRLFGACTLQEFAAAALLRLEVNEEAGYIGAVRGGYRAPLAKLRSAWFLPSAFNDRRYWSAYEEADGIYAYFPYFDPSLSLDQGPGRSASSPELDIALLCKALGDPTRFAMATLLARGEVSSAELARQLGVSKPTVTHHVHLLREAGLLGERALNGAVRLSLRRGVIEALTPLALKRLYTT